MFNALLACSACYWPVPGSFRLLLACSWVVPLVTDLFLACSACYWLVPLVPCFRNVDSVISDGIITCSENDSEKDVPIKVRDSLREKFSLLGADDFESIKVRHKRISKPALPPRTEFDYKVVKKFAGQGLLCLQMKQGCEYITEGNENGSDDTILLKPYNEGGDDNVPETQSEVPTDRKVQVIDIVDNEVAEKAVDTRSGNQGSSINTEQVFKKPPPAFYIQPIIDEIKRESYIDPVEILRSLQKKLHKGRDLHMSSPEDTPAQGSTNVLFISYPDHPPGNPGGQQNFCAQMPGGRENLS